MELSFIVQLAQRIATKTAIVDEYYYRLHNLTTPSFGLDTPSVASKLSNELEVERQAIIHDCQDLRLLLEVPSERFHSYMVPADLATQDAIVRFGLAKAFAPGSEATFAQIAKAVGIDERDTREGYTLPSEVASRVDFLAHDFLVNIQPVANAEVYFFRVVLHNFPDNVAIAILRNLIPAMKARGKHVINDVVVPRIGERPAGALANVRASDLVMSAFFNASEGDLSQWTELLRAADTRFKVPKGTVPRLFEKLKHNGNVNHSHHRRLGQALVKTYLARPNHIVIGTARNLAAPGLEQLKETPKAEGTTLLLVKMDSTSPNDPAAAVKELEKSGVDHVDTVIASAAHNPPWDPVEKVGFEDLTTALQANALGPLILFQALKAWLQKSNSPRWLSISSSVASIGSIDRFGSHMLPAYGMSKAALNWFTV
ncbi:putative aflatoxin biosynthesis ketoreductase nor-1 [Paramyrothecium foliicola]|nr:putative aflatoxin biosynthesis ketoreductase nor-1 [Paramyrothecium foliicola]